MSKLYSNEFNKLHVNNDLTVGGKIIVGNAINMQGKLINNLGDPLIDTDAATKKYVDASNNGMDYKESCRISTILNITNFSSRVAIESALDTISGSPVTLEYNERILVKNQNNAIENGIYVWISANVAIRSDDMNGTPSNEISGGNITFVEEGDAGTNTEWLIIGNGVRRIGIDNIMWTKIASIGILSLDNLSNVIITNSKQFDALLYNTSNGSWENFDYPGSKLQVGLPQSDIYSIQIGINASDTISTAIDKLDKYILQTDIVFLPDNSNLAVDIPDTRKQGIYNLLIKSTNDNGSGGNFVAFSSMDASIGTVSKLISGASSSGEVVDVIWPENNKLQLFHSTSKSGGTGALISYNIKISSTYN